MGSRQLVIIIDAADPLSFFSLSLMIKNSFSVFFFLFFRLSCDNCVGLSGNRIKTFFQVFS